MFYVIFHTLTKPLAAWAMGLRVLFKPKTNTLVNGLRCDRAFSCSMRIDIRLLTGFLEMLTDFFLNLIPRSRHDENIVGTVFDSP